MSARPTPYQARVAIGARAAPVGKLAFVRDRRREYCAFAYGEAWLHSQERFEISPDLPLRDGWVTRRAPTEQDSPFPFALADTAPDAWGARVIRRAHAKRRAQNPSLAPLTAFDLLAAVDDFSRVGALRLIDANGQFLRSMPHELTPQLIDLGRIAQAARHVEEGVETAGDLEYLQGKATSLGGLRPKCTVLEEDGSLAIGKFPSAQDEHSVVRAEVLALNLYAQAGCRVAGARVFCIDQTDVAVIRRFDRLANGARIPYLSGGSVLRARRDEDRTYFELADAIRAISPDPTADTRELWRRLVANLLLNNVDDHLWNVGFLYAGDGKWELAPAFDVNPFPDKTHESKTWLSEDTGPITSFEQLLAGSRYFGLSRTDAEAIAAAVAVALGTWRSLASSREVGLTAKELAALEPAFEHDDARAARALAR